MAMNLEVFRQYLALKQEKSDLEQQLETVKERMQFFQDLIMDELVENGVDSVRVDGKNVFPKRQLFASASVLTPDFKQALIESGAVDLVQETVNSQRLSGFVREYMRDNDIPEITGLPDWMKNGMNITEKVTLGVRG